MSYEAHRLKNAESRLSVDVSTLKRGHTILLTGTPLQNSMTELWSLLHFMQPKRFDSLDRFLNKFGDLGSEGHERLKELHQMLRMYLLRREKEHVEKNLPKKHEKIVEVPLMPLQKQYYRAIYERNTDFLLRGGKASNGPSLNNIAMELRKCCNHPYLIRGAEDALSSGIRKSDTEEIFKRLIQCSGKLVCLDKLLTRLRREGHKVLLFSQMVRMLDILADYARYRNFPLSRIDGRTRGIERQRAIDKYVVFERGVRARSAKFQSIHFFMFQLRPQITRINLASLAHNANKLLENQCSDAKSITNTNARTQVLQRSRFVFDASVHESWWCGYQSHCCGCCDHL